MSGHSFKPLHGSSEGYDSGGGPGMTTQITVGAPGQYQTTSTYHYPGQHPAAYATAAGAGAGAAMLGADAYRGAQYQSMDTDQAPLTREFDDFSRGFQDALDRIGEEDEEHHASGDLGERGSSSASGNGTGSGMGSGTGTGSGSSTSYTNGNMVSGNGNGFGVGTGAGGVGWGQQPQPAELADGQAAAEESGDPPQPLWQQNRRQSRNLMWM